MGVQKFEKLLNFNLYLLNFFQVDRIKKLINDFLEFQFKMRERARMKNSDDSDEDEEDNFKAKFDMMAKLKGGMSGAGSVAGTSVTGGKGQLNISTKSGGAGSNQSMVNP